MSISDMLNSFVCCERQDESKYTADACDGCPQIEIVTQSLEKTVEICGHSEYVGDGIVASSPPLKYETETFTFDEVLKEWRCDCGDRVIDHNKSYSGSLTKTIDCDGESDDGPHVATEYNYTYDRDNFFPPCTLTLDETLTTDFDVNYQAASGEVASTTQRGEFTEFYDESFSGNCDGQQSRIRTNNSSWALSDLVDESAALADAEETEGESLSSIWETRSTGFVYVKRTVKYAALLTGLKVDLKYVGAIPLQKRTAVVDAPGAWTAENSIEIPEFTASQQFEIIGGTLNAGITPQEFIDAAYDLDPTVYGLAATAHVVIADTDLTHTQGWEYELGDNPAGDLVYAQRS